MSSVALGMSRYAPGGVRPVRPVGFAFRMIVATLALTYPFHITTSIGPVRGNISLGDPVALLIMLMGAVGLLGATRFPRYMPHVMAITAVLVFSLFFLFALPTAERMVWVSPTVGVQKFVKYVGSVVWLVATFLLVRRHPLVALRTFALVSVLLATGFALYTVHQGILLGHRSPSGPFENPNIYGNWLVFNVFLAGMAVRLPFNRFAWIRQPRLLYFVIPVLVVGVLATGSRGSLLGLGAGTVLTVMWRLRGFNARRIVSGAALLTAAVGGIYWFLESNPFIANRLLSTAAGEGPNMASRFEIWGAAVDAFAQSPLFGVGYGQFPFFASLLHTSTAREAHSTYLAIAAELGLLGLVAWGALLWRLISDALALRRSALAPVAVFPCAFFGALLVQGVSANVDAFRSLWITIAMIGALRAYSIASSRRPVSVPVLERVSRRLVGIPGAGARA